MQCWSRNRQLIYLVAIALIIAPASTIPTVAAVNGAGSLQLSLASYGTVQGQLQNAIIYPNNTILMTMNVNDRLQTSLGTIPITATGTWTGVRSDSAVSGSIGNVAGKAQICIIFSCNDANYAGQGQWSGSINATQANGIFQGTITFTNSPVSQIPVGQPISISGTWTADFMIPVPEFGSEFKVFLLVYAIVLFVVHRKRRLWN
jgi:hypothetical protein